MGPEAALGPAFLVVALPACFVLPLILATICDLIESVLTLPNHSSISPLSSSSGSGRSRKF